MTERDKLANEIAAFLKRTGIPPTNMAVACTGERGLVRRILAGSDCLLGTADAIRAYMAAYDAACKPKRDRAA